MFKIESYVTPILLSYVDKYVRDFKPADAQVSLWGGGVALHNLVLKADVLQQEVSLPFTLVSGRIHELLIQVPWTKIMSEPIVVTIDTIECVLSLNPPIPSDGTPPPESPSRKAAVVEAPPGYMQALVRRIVSNIALRVQHLIVKYVQDDIVLSLNVKHVAVDSAGVNWDPAFADIDPGFPVIRRLVRLDDLTLCLDRADSDGKIRYYQEPLLYRCQLNFRVSTKLVSANTRRASSLAVQLRSSKLAFSVTNDQLILLIRLLRERVTVTDKQAPPPTKIANAARETPLHTSSANSAEPARQESWSEWAWSWLPTWMDKEGGVEEAPMPATPIPAYFTAYLDHISLVYKIMELEATTRKRARSILELSAIHAAIKSTICSPTTLRVRFGTRLLSLSSYGKCVCGQVNYEASQNLPTVYMKKASSEEEQSEWVWPDEDFSEQKIECAQVADEEYRESPEPPLTTQSQNRSTIDTSQSNPGQPEEPQPRPSPVQDSDELWQQMSPVLFIEYTHERSHPDRFANPYDSPPQDFEYSDWEELCNVKVKLEPIELRICMSLIHRLQALKSALMELPPVPEQEIVMRTLTVEENDALNDNLPQRRVVIEMRGLSTRVHPADHTTHHHYHDRSSQPPLILDVDLPNATIVLNGPLYPQRVCAAACQLPEDVGPLFQAARLNVSMTVPALQFRIVSPKETQPRPCARTDLRLVMHILLNKEYFKKREKESVEFAYSFKIRELNVSGSAARLQAAYLIPMSLVTQRISPPLKYTSLTSDAIHDEEAVALDVTIEDVSVRGYVTRNINTHIVSVQSARATAVQAPNNEETKQAWIFSAPEIPSTSPYLRLAAQWCSQVVPNCFDYLGLWTEPTAFAVDPLFIAFLAYAPQVKNFESLSVSSGNIGKTQFFHRRRPTPPSSSGRSGRAGAELVHVRPRSQSGSEPSDKKESKHVTMTAKSLDQIISSEKLIGLHERLRHMLINVEMGLVLVYVTTSTASALDCANVRDAMERHAHSNSVLAIALGRLSMHSSSAKKHLWSIIRHDGPTFVDKKDSSEEEESFPWKLRLADMSCYTLQAPAQCLERADVDLAPKGIRSHLKKTGVNPRTVLESTTTTVTLSVVTKSMKIKMPPKAEKKKSTSTEKPGEERAKYFRGGIDFKPTTLKEFVRGPSTKRRKSEAPTEKETEEDSNMHTMVGPVVSMGVHIHADTPPVILRIDHDQVNVIASAIHCFRHMLTLPQRPPVAGPKCRQSARSSLVKTNTNTWSLPRSVSEIEEVRDSQSESEISENPSELISIFEATYSIDQSSIKMKKLLWFQWVISRATLVVSTPQVKFAIDVDDIISTIDLQEHYNQLKLKLASASVKHYDRTESEDWSPGVLGGRVLEAREPTDQKEENHFLSITITQAQISNLPASWKNELHPKMLERKTSSDTMWEVYATLAPLEAVVQPTILEHMVLLVHQLSPKSFCPLQVEPEQRPSDVNWQWPFFFVTAGGLRLLVTGDEEKPESDDTFVFSIGKITVNPHPENPIYRRPINCNDPSWSSHNLVYEGRQYEILINDVCVRSAQFRQIVNEESAERIKAQENPAVKWTLPLKQTIVTPVLHSVDVSCVFAPAHFVSGVLACGPAVELNFVSDCAVEVSIKQLELMQRIAGDMRHSLNDTSSSSGLLREEKYGICPYANLISNQEHPEPSTTTFNATTYADADTRADSGIDTGTSHSNKSIRDEQAVKKSVSVAFAAESTWTDANEHLEVFVTMGMIELSLYVADDDSPEIAALRCPSEEVTSTATVDLPQTVAPQEEKLPSKKEGSFLRRSDRVSKSGSTQSITDNIRKADIENTALDNTKMTRARGIEGNLPLIHVTFYQPNLYYWRKKNQQILQISLFNAWLGLGVGQLEGHWHLSLLSTSKGVPDPVTDIRPALATMKIVMPIGFASIGPGSGRGTISLDVERPVQLEVSTERLRRLKGILGLIQDRVPSQPDSLQSLATPAQEHIVYKFRRFTGSNTLESITIQTSQIAVNGSEGTCGWESASLQMASGARPERVVARVLVTSLLVAAGAPGDRRHVLLQPLVLGVELDATWEAWRKTEFGPDSHVPTIRASVSLDNVIMDLRPEDLATLKATLELLNTFKTEEDHQPDSSGQTLYQSRKDSFMSALTGSPLFSTADTDLTDHYYKDDLRSGAFKIVRGGQLPMAYQVTVQGNAVSWRYPHPRAITRIVAFPLPGLDEEIDCVLELYSRIQHRWMSHTYFKLPVSEPREIKLYGTPPEVAFAQTWRVRACSEDTEIEPPVEFNSFNYMPRDDPFGSETILENDMAPKHISGVTAEELSGVLRVDSYFAPRLLPRIRVACLVTGLEINLHNSLPELSSQATELEGYYVSRPLMRSHRVLALLARHWCLNCHLGSRAGAMMLVSGKIAADVLESATGTIEELVEEFTVRGAVSVPADTGVLSKPRSRVRTTRVHVTLHVPRVRTIHALAKDWMNVINTKDASQDVEQEALHSYASKSALAKATEEALEGRVALWIHNSCGSALRVGQEGTDEVVPLGPGARLAYRWRSPTAPKRLRFAVAGPTADWRWSNSIPFVAGSTRIRLEEGDTLGDGKVTPGAGVFMYVRVEDTGATKSMHLVGRLTLANLLRYNLLYKVRARCSGNQWRGVCSGELLAESIGRTVIAGADCDMVLKIKFLAHDTGWSGDIPLKECPKENVPWLVKVPSSGDIPYTSVWCRVTRARSDGRVLATVWPLYVLHSHLPLDTDVMISTNTTDVSNTEMTFEETPPLVQTAPGRGTCTHLVAPGTTSARHSLSFQYRNIECPVTREAVPMHYGVTDTSVFDKRSPVNNIDEVILEVHEWLRRSGKNTTSTWPYSLVTKHYPGTWQPALLQPRCDVTVRYQAIRAGGGCSLEIQLCPLVILCNAAPIALTLRAHDAAPLCKLEPGSAISLPSGVLKKPFFMSIEMGRETFVSGQLEVSIAEPGRYGAPPPGKLAVDHSAEFSILCNQKVALLTMYYEIKEEINVLGASSTYVILNRLGEDLLVSAVTMAADQETNSVLRNTAYKVIPPTKQDSVHGTPLCRFWLRGRWRGNSPTELRSYICLALPCRSGVSNLVPPAHDPVPIRLATGAMSRRAVALIDWENKSIPVVVTQMKQDGRCLISVARDPCPQFVVYNRTRTPLCIAQPLLYRDEPSTSLTSAEKECEGARWWCSVPPGATTHYSTPAYCARYPPPATPRPTELPFITFAKTKEEGEHSWCPAVVAADGEQLLQLQGGITVKLRVRTNPHSTLLELQDVDHTDLSASDIRRRLYGPFASEPGSSDIPHLPAIAPSPSKRLERVKADEKLLHRIRLEQSPAVKSSIPSQGKGPQVQSVASIDDIKPFARPTTSGELGAIKNPTKSSLEIQKSESNDEILLETGQDKRKRASLDANEARENLNQPENTSSDSSFVFHDLEYSDWNNGESWPPSDRARCVIDAIVIEVAATADARPLLALHADRVALHVLAHHKRTRTTLSISDVQIDNLQYDSGQFDFGVVASTRNEPLAIDRWPALWNMFADRDSFETRRHEARLLLILQHDRWTVAEHTYNELTEVDVALGPLALYVEDAYVSALVALWRLGVPTAPLTEAECTLADERILQCPLRLRALHLRPLDLTLTLHTAVRMYIALDQSPLRLTAFRLQDMMTSPERLTHALTVHYLSAAILGAGWVVGGLELLGAPGALAARLGEASGGVRGIVSATAAALLRSLSAWAGSLARNLDLLAGDEEHARRAAAARRRPPQTFMAGLAAGITNFAINILGAVGGLAHHPLVGVAVGETESGAAALRRGLVGALTKPLSATADLVAYAGHGLLSQTGWDPIPQPRLLDREREARSQACWRRDSVRWCFRLCELHAVSGFEVLLDNAPLQLLLTHKFLVVADPVSERIVEMIDFRFCSVGPYQGAVIELSVSQRRTPKAVEQRAPDEDDEYQITAAAMARVARYTGAESSAGEHGRVLQLMSAPARAHALHAALLAAIHHNADTHFALL